LEIELNDRINELESKTGIFSNDAGMSLRIELQKAKDNIYKLSDENDLLVKQNDSLQIRLHNSQKHCYLAIEDKHTYRGKMERMLEMRKFEDTALEQQKFQIENLEEQIRMIEADRDQTLMIIKRDYPAAYRSIQVDIFTEA
jgi:hypothetical protein